MDALRAGYTYPKGRLLPLALGCVKVSSFLTAKTSAKDTPLLKNVGPRSKRFLYYVCKLFVCDCKGTTKFADVQILC